ncbi:hypothetical protein DUHN55_40820 [Helicobacter pylori]
MPGVDVGWTGCTAGATGRRPDVAVREPREPAVDEAVRVAAVRVEVLRRAAARRRASVGVAAGGAPSGRGTTVRRGVRGVDDFFGREVEEREEVTDSPFALVVVGTWAEGPVSSGVVRRRARSPPARSAAAATALAFLAAGFFVAVFFAAVDSLAGVVFFAADVFAGVAFFLAVDVFAAVLFFFAPGAGVLSAITSHSRGRTRSASRPRRP